jgi:hypothetical protein
MKHSSRVKAAMRAGRKAYGYNLSFPSPWVIDNYIDSKDIISQRNFLFFLSFSRFNSPAPTK